MLHFIFFRYEVEFKRKKFSKIMEWHEHLVSKVRYLIQQIIRLFIGFPWELYPHFIERQQGALTQFFLLLLLGDLVFLIINK